MSLREYIRTFITNDFGSKIITHSFSNVADDVYSPKEIKEECEFLGGDFIDEDMQLSYFSLDYLGEVNGAAWTEINENGYNFVIFTTDEASDQIYEELIYDCMDEFSFLREETNNLKLAIEVFDDETKKLLSENWQLNIIKEKDGFYIMGE